MDYRLVVVTRRGIYIEPIAPLSAYAMRCASVVSECRHDSRMSGDAISRSHDWHPMVWPLRRL
jgi:hypothetical protein